MYEVGGGEEQQAPNRVCCRSHRNQTTESRHLPFSLWEVTQAPKKAGECPEMRVFLATRLAYWLWAVYSRKRLLRRSARYTKDFDCSLTLQNVACGENPVTERKTRWPGCHLPRYLHFLLNLLWPQPQPPLRLGGDGFLFPPSPPIPFGGKGTHLGTSTAH